MGWKSSRMKKTNRNMLLAAVMILLVGGGLGAVQQFDADERQHRQKDEVNFLNAMSKTQQRGLEIAAEYARQERAAVAAGREAGRRGARN